MPNFPLVLSDATAERIRKLNTIFGGTVGGFAANHVTDLADLEPETIVTVRQQVSQLARDARAKRNSGKDTAQAGY